MMRHAWIVLALVPLATRNAAAQCDDWYPGGFEHSAPGADGTISAATTWDPDGAGPQPTLLVVGGGFDEICGLSAHGVAAWNGVHWSPVGGGLSGTVRDLIVFNGELVATGVFPGGIARWHVGAWVPMGPLEGPGAHGAALAVYNGALIVGGEFDSVAGVAAGNIARWNGAAWSSLGGSGVSGNTYPIVLSLAVFNGDLIVGGTFSAAGLFGGVNNIARWNGTLWSPMGSGVLVSGQPVQTQVRALAVYNGVLYAGGTFDTAGGSPAARIARWTGSAWQALGAGVNVGYCSASTHVHALTVFNGSLLVGGNFAGAGGVPAKSLAAWNGTTWSAPATGLAGLVCNDATARCLEVYGSALVVGGTYLTAGGVAANNIARWNGSSWFAFQSPWFVYSFAQWGSRLVAAGFFAQSTGSSAAPAYHVAAWDGLTLTELDGGLNNTARTLKVYNPTIISPPELVCGGSFTMAGGVAANRIARMRGNFVAFPPPEWEPMGAGFDDTVHAIERFNNATYAGGEFGSSGAAAVSRIARWDGAAWQPVGAGVNGTVYALRAGASSPTSVELLVGGSFTTAGGAAASRIARWVMNPSVPGSGSWSAMGAGLNGTVRAIERHHNETYAAGDFTASGLTTMNRVARWNGSAWAPVGSGFPVSVYALRSVGSYLYAGGAFTTLAGSVANGVARWDGGSWTQVHGGADSSVFALAAFQGEVHAGGAFLNVDGGSLESAGWARYNPTGAPAIAQQPVAASIECGEPAAFTVKTAAGYSGHTYRWRRDGAPLVNGPTGTGSSITGAAGATLFVQNASGADEGSYSCVVAGSCAASTSNGASLTVSGCCYPDCNADGALTVSDFGCFQTQFVAGSAYADCNGDGALTVSDFGCFQTRFVAGCP